MSRQRIIVTTAVAVLAFLSGGWFMQQGTRRDDSVYQRARLFEDVLAHLADYYVDSLDERQLYQMAIDGMVRELHDPYSVFLDQRDIRSLSEATTGNYGGLGIQIEVRDGAILVVAPLPDTPAERAGITTGDRIIEVNGQSTARWNQDQAVRALRGPEGTQVTIRVARPGVPELISYQLTRARIHARSVRLSMMLGDRVGYVELQNFTQATQRELSAAIDSLRGGGMRSLILDLRNNPGGLLDEGIAVSDLFLDRGQAVVETRGRARGASRTFTDTQPQRFPDLPIVVLVNGASASASEIVAGALQDHDRALLVGTPTFGKGLVQTVFQLSNDAALKLTTARWYTPSGRSINRPGRTEEEQERLAEAGDTARADTTRRLETFRTSHGRAVLGGGTITPDVVIRADSADLEAARRLDAVLGRNVTKYWDAVAALALDVRARRAVQSPTFVVTPEISSAFLRLLGERGVTLDRTVIEATQSFIDRQLGYQIARYVFGRAGEVRRMASEDRTMSEAVRFAGRARTPSELLALAASTPATPAQRP